MQENPLWPVTTRFPKLEADVNVDVAIVGGGIAGISCAYYLHTAGYNVMILEQDEVGSAASGASSGILYYGTGTNFVDAIDLFGKETATMLWKESEESISDMIELIDTEQLVCGLRQPGAIMVAQTHGDKSFLTDEHGALKSIGIESRLLNSAGIKTFFTLRDFLAGLEFPICGQIHPAVFAAELAKKKNLSVYEYTPMTDFIEQTDGVVLKTPAANVTCKEMIVATNLQPFFGLEKQFAVESSALFASQPMEDQTLRAIWPEEKFIWTTEQEYDIIYPQTGRAILEVYRLKTAKEKIGYYFPGVEFIVDRRWGDSWSKTRDWLPIIGRIRPHIFAAVAMGDQGVVMGFTAGRKIVQLIKGKEDPFLTLSSPRRFGPLV